MENNISEQSLVELFEELLTVPSPSGHENRIARFIQSKIESMGYVFQTDGSENTYVLLDGIDILAPKCCVAAHIDEVSLIVSGIDMDGSIRVISSGGLLVRKLGERPGDILGD
ncbi:MAG: hypothetical protein MUO76_12310, partial [Anaerolineaceae bacterium]|nr:hypothetical protein [Anaerolineaceae bacterium]